MLKYLQKLKEIKQNKTKNHSPRLCLPNKRHQFTYAPQKFQANLICSSDFLITLINFKTKLLRMKAHK